MLFGWFGTVIGESEGGLYNLQGRLVVPLGDELVHLFRSHVLRRVLRHAVLRARARRAVARRRGRQLLHELPALAGLREHLAVDGPARRARRAHGRLGPPALNTAILLLVGRHDHDRAPCAARGPSHAAHHLAAATFLLGFMFLGLQAEEYIHAYTRARPKARHAASTAARSSC